MIAFSLLRGFLLKEFKQTLRDPRAKFVLFVAPIIQLILFGVAISSDIKNVRLWTKLDTQDYFLEHIYEHSIGSKWFLPAADIVTAEPYDLLRGKEVDAALIPPPGGLTKAIGRGTADLQLLVDATNVLKAQSIEAYIKNITESSVQEDLKVAPITTPINFVARVLFNPMLDTTYFMIPGVISLLICVVTMVLTSISITKERERGTLEMLISAPISSTEIILGKTLPHIIVALCDVPFILIVATIFFGVPVHGSLLVLFLAAITFTCAMGAVGVLISTFARNQQQSMLGTLLFIFPSILLSGLMFPIENMPTLMRGVAYLNPLYHFLLLIRNIMLKGGEFYFLTFHIGVLMLMALVFIYISFKRFRTTLQ